MLDSIHNEMGDLELVHVNGQNVGCLLVLRWLVGVKGGIQSIDTLGWIHGCWWGPSVSESPVGSREGPREGRRDRYLHATKYPGMEASKHQCIIPCGKKKKKREKRVISSDCEAGPELQVPRR